MHTNKGPTIASDLPHIDLLLFCWLWAAHAVLAGDVRQQLGRTGDAAQEGALLQGERQAGRRRQELRDRANSQNRKKLDLSKWYLHLPYRL